MAQADVFRAKRMEENATRWLRIQEARRARAAEVDAMVPALADALDALRSFADELRDLDDPTLAAFMHKAGRVVDERRGELSNQLYAESATLRKVRSLFHEHPFDQIFRSRI
jgi:hypothetical protein